MEPGILLSPDGNQINYKAPTGSMTSELVEMIKAHKQEILSILNADRQKKFISSSPSANTDQNILQDDCDSCPAAGYWSYIGPGKWCFYSAYFLGKPAQPIRCKTARRDCPLRKNGS